MKLIEVQVDRIVGPTHHFGGLGVGNVASKQNSGSASNPRLAAIQGLEKMQLVAQMGVPQLVLPPQPRPDERFLGSLGFDSTQDDLLQSVAAAAPRILSAAMSSSAMWTANAATVAASVDGYQPYATLTVANLNSSIHRAIEPSQTLADLWQSLPHSVLILDPLRGGAMMRDEGAANHMRLGSDQAKPGIHIFVYGDQDPMPETFWPRQTLAACQAVARLHRLPTENTFFLKQHPNAIDAGAFHNDVVAASHHHLLVHHELAFYDATESLQKIAKRYSQLYDRELTRIEVAESTLTIGDAVKTYLFNSQIVSPDNEPLPTILCPAQVAENSTANKIVQSWCDQSHFGAVEFLDLRQSMSGGGGPACLRLRIPLTQKELAEIPFPNRWSPVLHDALCEVIEKHYPTEVHFADLSNSQLIQQAATAEEAIRELLRHH